MNVIHHPRFTKSFNKRIKPFSSQLEQFKERWQMFEQDSQNPILKDHPLKGTLKGFRAFSITGDIRLVYRKEEDDFILYDIGTHNQVYK